MPKFAKSPKVIAGVLIVLWLAYVIWANFDVQTYTIYLLPFGVTLQAKVSAIIIASIIFGAMMTLVIQFLWNRRSSKKASVSAAP